MCSRNVLGIVQREEFIGISGKCDTVVDERRFNPLKAELYPICHLLALLAHHILHVSRIRVNVFKYVHHRTIQINHQPDTKIFQFYYPDVYLKLNMFWAFSRPSSGAQRLQ
jgi:hypothetical protein